MITLTPLIIYLKPAEFLHWSVFLKAFSLLIDILWKIHVGLIIALLISPQVLSYLTSVYTDLSWSAILEKIKKYCHKRSLQLLG